MKPSIPIGLVLLLLGARCNLPQRINTFIPPTNERDLCKTDRRFIYSNAYEYCFRIPDQGWEHVTHTDHRDTVIPSVTSDDFFADNNGVAQHLFTIYVGPSNKFTKDTFASEHITVAHESSRFFVGYKIDQEAFSVNPDIANTITHTLDNLYFFTPDGTRQADEP